MNQHLKTTAFFVTSKTAIENQVYVALIAYLLLILARRRMNTTATLLTCQRLLKTLIWNTWDKITYSSTDRQRGRQKADKSEKSKAKESLPYGR
jgi:hypothetical protein